MPTFTDAAGRTWTVTITVATLKRIRALAGIDLLEAVGGTLLDRLVSDPVLLGDVLYAVVKPEADARAVSDEAFGQCLAGDAIDGATTALLEAFVDFFPKPRWRVLSQALTKLAGWRAAALAAAEERLADPALETQVLAVLRQPPTAAPPPGASSGSAPASAASIPPA